MMKDLQLGQVYREYGETDFGHIQRFEVISVHKRFAMVRNMATLAQVCVTHDAESSFTFRCELMPNEKGWN